MLLVTGVVNLTQLESEGANYIAAATVNVESGHAWE